MERYDIAIIGTGPAGLSAALTAKLRNKNILLLGNNNLSNKIEKAPIIQNYLGLPNVSGDKLKDAFSEHLRTNDILITEDKIIAVYAMGKYYAIQGTSQNYEASSVILATGINNVKSLQGEDEFLGRGVSYCATCDAALYRNKKVAIIGFSPKEETEADFMVEFASEVLYFPMYPKETQVTDSVQVIYEKPLAVIGTMKVQKLVTETSSHDVDGIFILRESISPSQLVPKLQMKENHIAVNRKLETNLPGCFACGDVTGTPYQYMKAAGEGNVAALSAVSYLNQFA